MLQTLIAQLPSYVLLFAAFSIAGWCMEVVLKFIQYRRFINRGYLLGPYCPIYGWGALLVTLVANGVFFRKCTPAETFLIGFFVCGALEYAVSWCMEKISHARWWDYSQKPMNLNGRVWIGNLLLFSAAAVGIVYLADPLLFGLFAKLSPRALHIIAGAFLVVLWTDRVISHFMMKLLRHSIEHQAADDTEEIRGEMRLLLKDRRLLLRRVAQAYPELRPIPEKLAGRLKQARSEYRAAAKRLSDELDKLDANLRARKRKTAAGATAALRQRVSAAGEAKRRAQEKLRRLENDLFGK